MLIPTIAHFVSGDLSVKLMNDTEVVAVETGTVTTAIQGVDRGPQVHWFRSTVPNGRDPARLGHSPMCFVLRKTKTVDPVANRDLIPQTVVETGG